MAACVSWLIFEGAPSQQVCASKRTPAHACNLTPQSSKQPVQLSSHLGGTTQLCPPHQAIRAVGIIGIFQCVEHLGCGAAGGRREGERGRAERTATAGSRQKGRQGRAAIQRSFMHCLRGGC